jgi:hypothetical protein
MGARGMVFWWRACLGAVDCEYLGQDEAGAMPACVLRTFWGNHGAWISNMTSSVLDRFCGM